MRQKRYAQAMAALIVLALTIAFVDRPLALFVYWYARPVRAPFIFVTHIIDVLEVLALITLATSVWSLSKGRALDGWKDAAFRASLSLFIASGVKDTLKIAFGRTWPETWVAQNPSFIRDGVFGFWPLHGGVGWSAFPSGHTTLIFAVAACLWPLLPRFRAIYAGLALLCGFSLVAANYHWLSDVLAGAIIGTLIGSLMARLNLPACSRLALESK